MAGKNILLLRQLVKGFWQPWFLLEKKFIDKEGKKIALRNTLRELIFAGTNFCGFCGFGLKPQNLVPIKLLSTYELQKLIPAKFFKIGHPQK